MKPFGATVLLLSATLGCGEGGQVQPGTTGALANAQVGDAFDGPVVSIIDGDTISVLRDGEQVRVRVEGIDTPESDQAFGAQALHSRHRSCVINVSQCTSVTWIVTGGWSAGYRLMALT